MKRIDINCDMGEQETIQGLKGDLEIMPYISSCNVSCGFHSGNPFIIQKTIRGAIQHQIKIGAHPSYDDRKNFGRLSLDVEHDVLKAQLKYQICAIKGMVESLGQSLNHVKPHGALYNDMAKNESLAQVFVEVIKEVDPSLKIYGMSESIFMEVCQSQNMSFVKEGFADRKYASKVALRSRKLNQSVLTDPADVLRQIGFLIDGRVEVYSGEIEPLNIDTICVHSDTKGAASLCQLIHDYIIEKEIAIG